MKIRKFHSNFTLQGIWRTFWCAGGQPLNVYFFPAPTRRDQSLGRPRFGLSQLRMANKRSQVVALALLSPFPSTPLSNCQVIGARRLPLYDEVPFSGLSRPTLHQILSHPDFLIGKVKFHSLRWLFCTELSHSFRWQ